MRPRAALRRSRRCNELISRDAKRHLPMAIIPARFGRSLPTSKSVPAGISIIHGTKQLHRRESRSDRTRAGRRLPVGLGPGTGAPPAVSDLRYTGFWIMDSGFWTCWMMSAFVSPSGLRSLPRSPEFGSLSRVAKFHTMQWLDGLGRIASE